MPSEIVVGEKVDAFLTQCQDMTWFERACCIRALWTEMKRRNPIGINCYEGSMAGAYFAVEEIAKAEKINPSAEAGPGIDKKKRKVNG